MLLGSNEDKENVHNSECNVLLTDIITRPYKTTNVMH